MSQQHQSFLLSTWNCSLSTSCLYYHRMLLWVYTYTPWSIFLFIWVIPYLLGLEKVYHWKRWDFFSRQSENRDHLEFEECQWEITKQNNAHPHLSPAMHRSSSATPFTPTKSTEILVTVLKEKTDILQILQLQKSLQTSEQEGIPNSRWWGAAPFCYRSMWEIPTCENTELSLHVWHDCLWFYSPLFCFPVALSVCSSVQQRALSHPVLAGLAVYCRENSGQPVRHGNDQVWAGASG